jgi:F0F1-type ATP synthase membrane subunit b/b'
MSDHSGSDFSDDEGHNLAVTKASLGAVLTSLRSVSRMRKRLQQISEAKAKAVAASAAKLAEAQGRLDTKLAEAEAAIEAARSSAMAEVEGVAADAARDIVARVAGADIKPAAAKAAVKKVMAHG